MDCNKCGESKDVQKIPYIAYEAECARHERTDKRKNWIIIFLIAVICFFALLLYLNNKRWVETFNEYDFEEIDYSQDGRGVNIIGDGNETRQFNGTETENQTEKP